MAHEETPAPTSVAATPRRGRRALYTAALAGGLVLGGFGIAAAQTDTTSPPTTEAPDGTTDEKPRQFEGERRHVGRMKGGPGFAMMGGGGALHGEFVTEDPDGDGYRTVVVQRGTVTAVSGSSITVRSEDGFSETYAVGDNTAVNAGDQGIGDVKVDDVVHVQAFVVDGSDDPEAAHVVNTTSLRSIHEHWRPGAGAPAEGSAA